MMGKLCMVFGIVVLLTVSVSAHDAGWYIGKDALTNPGDWRLTAIDYRNRIMVEALGTGHFVHFGPVVDGKLAIVTVLVRWPVNRTEVFYTDKIMCQTQEGFGGHPVARTSSSGDFALGNDYYVLRAGDESNDVENQQSIKLIYVLGNNDQISGLEYLAEQVSPIASDIPLPPTLPLPPPNS